VVEIAPDTPAPRMIPPAITPIGPPITINAIPAPVVAALVVPAIATSFFFFFLFKAILSRSFVSSPGVKELLTVSLLPLKTSLEFISYN